MLGIGLFYVLISVLSHTNLSTFSWQHHFNGVANKKKITAKWALRCCKWGELTFPEHHRTNFHNLCAIIPLIAMATARLQPAQEEKT